MKDLWIHMVGVLFHGLLSPEISAVISSPTYMPGQDLTVTFIVKNSVSEGELHLPPGWRILSQLKMPHSQGTSYFYTVKTDLHQAPGTATLDFRLLDHSASKKVSIPVLEHIKLTVLLLQPPQQARSFDTLHYTYLIQNSGNVAEQVYYTSCRGGGDVLALEPGESRRIVLSEGVGQDRQEHMHTLEYLSRGQYKQLTHTVPVFLSRPPKEETVDAWPLEVGIRYIGAQPGKKSYQLLAEGRGFLDKKKEQFLEVVLRGPDRRMFPMFGLQDHYSLYYAYKNKVKVDVGDFHLLHSPLMEPGRYGRGARIEGNTLRWRYAAFFQNARLFPDQRYSAGTSISYFMGKNSVYFRTFSKQYRYRPEWSQLLSLGFKREGETFFTEQEFSLGTFQQRAGAGAYSRIYYQNRKWGLHHQGILSSPDYHGFYYNSKMSSFQISHQLGKGLGWGIQHFYSKIQSRPDLTHFQNHPQSHNLSAWLSANLSGSQRIFASYLVGERKDTLAGYHYLENYGSLNYHLQRPRLQLQSMLRQGYTRTQREETGANQSYTSLNVQPALRLGENWWTGLYAEYQSTARFTGNRQIFFFYGGDIQYALGQGFALQLTYRNNYAPDELYQQRSLLQLNVRSQIGPHKLSVQGGTNFYPLPSGRVERITHFALTYTFRLGMQKLKKAPKGRVQGRVSGPGQGGVALYVSDKRYMTDASGNFDFGKMKVGKYRLKIAPTEAGILYPEMLELSVEKGRVHSLDIPLLKAASVLGKVSYPGAERPLILVKLYSQKGSDLTDIRTDGSFSFKMLKPGEYRLQVYLVDQDANFTWKQANEISFTLTEGEEKNLVFNLMPKERSIQFQSSPVHLKR